MTSVTVSKPKIIYLHEVYVPENMVKDNGTFCRLLDALLLGGKGELGLVQEQNFAIKFFRHGAETAHVG